MHMDTGFVEGQQFLIDEISSWSTLSPDLNWSSLIIEGQYQPTAPLYKCGLFINASERERSSDSEEWCGYEENVPEVSKKPFEIKSLQPSNSEGSLSKSMSLTNSANNC